MSRHWFCLALVGFPLTAAAAEPVFEDSAFLSTMYVTSSQSYQIKKQKCEVAGLFTSGNLVSKTIDLTLEGKSQGGGFDCGQSLEQNALVIGIKADIQQSTMDGVIVRYEDLSTTYAPYLAFQVSPTFSLGISEETTHGETKTLTGNYSSSTHRLLLSGTWHEGPWEITLAYADRYRDSILPNTDKPRSLGIAGRYMVSPLLTVGLVYARIDHPGVSSNGQSMDVEHDIAAAVTSRITDEVSVELSYMTEQASEGDKDGSSHIIGMMGQYALSPALKIGGFLNQYKGTSDAFDTNMTAFGFNVSHSP